MANNVTFHSVLADVCIRTVVYFDLFDYPLTAWEVRKFLWECHAGALEVYGALDELVGQGKLERMDGYYYLPGRSAIMQIRWQRYLLAEPKFKRALRAVRFLRYVPNVLTIATCNNLAYSNAKADSDIDLFIIVRRQRIWISRLLVTFVVQLLGLRRHGNKIMDRCCLSFYLTDDHLDISDLALREGDPYLSFWLATLSPLYDRQDTLAKFWQANANLLQHLPNAHPKRLSRRRTADTIIRRPHNCWAIGERLEAMAKLLQLRKMKNRPPHPVSDNSVVVSDSVLKFHELDRRARYRLEWEERLHTVLPSPR